MRDLRKLRSKYELRIDNRQIALLLVGELVILALVFSIGVVVGKNLGQFSNEVQIPDFTPLAGEGATPGTPDPLSLASAFNQEPTGATPEILDLTPSDLSPTPAETPLDITPPPTSSDLAPALEPTPATVDVAPLPAAPSGGNYWTVQVGSYPTRTEAEELQRKLAAKGNQAFIETALMGGTTWFRVTVGQFATESGARAMAAAMREREGLDPWVRYVP